MILVQRPRIRPEPPCAPVPDAALLSCHGGAWTIRFDDVTADALELGPLRSVVAELPEGGDWVALPVTNVDCYSGNTPLDISI